MKVKLKRGYSTRKILVAWLKIITNGWYRSAEKTGLVIKLA
ncbi:MAG TPA: hypothetical protein PLC76_07110 [Saprospiraceae bacterium]|jgi:hypothetical protein|nr:hypothetical protein [Saprospiraceae bacterium]HRN33262.1 hypothetical protein [Saprospiraceae bacterium]HRP84476.1 hypothetical protein [Saprospiraceae bacterium]